MKIICNSFFNKIFKLFYYRQIPLNNFDEFLKKLSSKLTVNKKIEIVLKILRGRFFD
jgi:hypothetical protein